MHWHPTQTILTQIHSSDLLLTVPASKYEFCHFLTHTDPNIRTCRKGDILPIGWHCPQSWNSPSLLLSKRGHLQIASSNFKISCFPVLHTTGGISHRSSQKGFLDLGQPKLRALQQQSNTGGCFRTTYVHVLGPKMSFRLYYLRYYRYSWLENAATMWR